MASLFEEEWDRTAFQFSSSLDDDRLQSTASDIENLFLGYLNIREMIGVRQRAFISTGNQLILLGRT